MCGRFVQPGSIEELKRFYKAISKINIHSNYNVTPQSEIPVVLYNSESQQREIQLLRWGLIPHWTKEEEISQRLINARAETIEEKPVFKNSYKSRRCIIPAVGFYEWKSKTKQPYFIRPKEGIFSFAGIWDKLIRAGNKNIITCAIITAEASSSIKKIHPRSPIILEEDEIEPWMNLGTSNSYLQKVLQPEKSVEIEYWAIDKKVNNPRNNNSSLIVDIKGSRELSINIR